MSRHVYQVNVVRRADYPGNPENSKLNKTITVNMICIYEECVAKSEMATLQLFLYNG